MTYVELYEHEKFNGGKNSTDVDGLSIRTSESIGDMRSITINKGSIRGWRFQKELDANVVVGFNDMVSSYRVVGPERVEFFEDVGFGALNFTVPPAPLEIQNLADSGIFGFNGNPIFNDRLSSLRIYKEGDPDPDPLEGVPAINGVEVSPSPAAVGDHVRLSVYFDRPAPRSGAFVGVFTVSDGAIQYLKPQPVSIGAPAGSRSCYCDFEIVDFPPGPRPTYYDFTCSTRRNAMTTKLRIKW